MVRTVVISLFVGIVAVTLLSINAFGVDIASFNKNNFADSIEVTFIGDDGKNKKFYSFSKIGFVKSKIAKFSLESVPSKDKMPFYELVKVQLDNPTKKLFDVKIDILAGDGSLIETLYYKKCELEKYFVYSNDSKGKYRFLEGKTSEMELREVSKFSCLRFLLEV